jgi:Domain of unknown function (DUF4190)
MTEPPDTPSERRENPEGTSQTAPPYPYPPGPYPGYPPAPPPPPYYGYPPPPVQPRNGLGITALVLAVIALVTVWSGFGGIVLGIVAVVIGFAGRGRVKRGEANNGGVAIAGIVLGALAVVVGSAFIAVWMTLGMTFWKDVGGGDYISCVQKAGSDPVKRQQCEEQFQQRVQDRLSVTLTPAPVP